MTSLKYRNNQAERKKFKRLCILAKLDKNQLNLYNYKEVKSKMTEEQKTEFVPRKPDYSGNGVAIWKANDKNGKLYLKVSVLGQKAINCFEVEDKEEVKEKTL